MPDESNGALELQRAMMREKAKSILGSVPQTPLSGSAFVGGPQPAQQQQEFLGAARGVVTPGQVAEGATPEPAEGVKTATETALHVGAAVAGASLGGAAGALVTAPRALLGWHKLARGTELLGRAVGGGTGQGLAGEVLAPTEETAEETRERRTTDFLMGAAGELGVPLVMAGGKLAGRAVGGAIRKGARRAHSKLEEGAEESQKLLLEHGATLTPGQARKGFLLDTLENIAEASFLGGGRVLARRQDAVAAAVEALDASMPKMVANLGTDEVGKLLSEAIENSSIMQRALTRAAYREVDTAIQQAGGIANVNLTPMIRGAADELAETALAGDRHAKGMLAIVNHFADNPVVSFKQADKLRSTLLRIGRADEDLVPGIQKYANKLAADVEHSMTVAARSAGQLGDDVIAKLAVARELTKFGKETFNHPLMANLIGKSAPEQIVRALFQADSPSAVKRVMAVLDNPQYRTIIEQSGYSPRQIERIVQGSFMRNIRRQAGDYLYGELDAGTLHGLIGKSGGTFQALFRDPVERAALQTSMRALELASKGASKGKSGAIFIQLSQAGALLSVAERTLLGAVPGREERKWAEGAILLGPAALAVALTRKSVASFLIRRALTKSDRSGRLAASTLAQMVATLRSENIPFTFQPNEGEPVVFEPSGRVPSQIQHYPARSPEKPVSKMRPQ